jgi:hypothetical protein
MTRRTEPRSGGTQFNAKIRGEQYMHLWPLMGYALRDRMAGK